MKCSNEIIYFQTNIKELQLLSVHYYFITYNRKLRPPCWVMFSVLHCYYSPYTLAAMMKIELPYSKVSIPNFCSLNCFAVSYISTISNGHRTFSILKLFYSLVRQPTLITEL